MALDVVFDDLALIATKEEMLAVVGKFDTFVRQVFVELPGKVVDLVQLHVPDLDASVCDGSQVPVVK